MLAASVVIGTNLGDEDFLRRGRTAWKRESVPSVWTDICCDFKIDLLPRDPIIRNAGISNDDVEMVSDFGDFGGHILRTSEDFET